MPKFRYILLLLLTITICYPSLYSKSISTTAASDTSMALSIQDSILERYKQKLIESYYYYRKRIGLDEAESQNSVQHFPVLLDETYQQIITQQFYTERYFSHLFALPIITQQQQLSNNQQNEKLIRISNIPVERGHLSSSFGMRKDPIHGAQQMHKGIDIAAQYGSVVKPLGKGTVVFVGYKAGYGNTVEIKHGNTVLTRYAHLKTFLVDSGQQVTIYDEIGLVGNTGRSTGPHLHLEVLLNGKQVDPQIFLANHFGSREYQVAQETPKKVKTKTQRETSSNAITSSEKYTDNNVASVKRPEVNGFSQISYRDIVNSVNGLYGFTAPSSFR